MGDLSLVERLREVCVDWAGELIVDASTPRYEVDCGMLREAATLIEQQAEMLAMAAEALRECHDQLWLLAKEPDKNPWVQQARATLAKLEAE